MVTVEAGATNIVTVGAWPCNMTPVEARHDNMTAVIRAVPFIFDINTEQSIIYDLIYTHSSTCHIISHTSTYNPLEYSIIKT